MTCNILIGTFSQQLANVKLGISPSQTQVPPDQCEACSCQPQSGEVMRKENMNQLELHSHIKVFALHWKFNSTKQPCCFCCVRVIPCKYHNIGRKTCVVPVHNLIRSLQVKTKRSNMVIPLLIGNPCNVYFAKPPYHKIEEFIPYHRKTNGS